MILPLWMVVLGLLVVPLSAEVYTSVQDLTRIFSVERKVVNALEDYIDKTEKRLNNLKRYLRDYEQVRAEVDFQDKKTPKEDDDRMWERLAGNPLHTYHLMKRLTLNWKHIEEYNPSADWMGVEEAKLTIKDVDFSQFENEEDLQGAAEGIVRLQKVYKLNTTSLIRGNIGGIQTSAELTAHDCLYMGKNSFNNGEFYSAIEWFEQAYILAGLEKNETITEEQALSFLAVAALTYEKTLQSKQVSTEVSKTDVAVTTNKAEKKYVIGKEISYPESLVNYEALCRGEQLLNDSFVATLKCFYDRRNSSYLTLMPAKVEQHHHKPELLLFHDVIREESIAKLKEFASPKLSRSTVVGPAGKGNIVRNVRTSRTYMLTAEDEMDYYFIKLNRYVSELTGLATDSLTNSSERLQIANYGVGGHYSIHHDYLMANKTPEELQEIFLPYQIRQGDRIATFMFYLSDVLWGGATAFPKLGVSVFPEKGAAAFWYNLKKSGEPDETTLHGGCPVIHGVKWVSNKWIRFGNQFRKRPCTLSKED